MANTSESEPALFPAKKGQKPPPIFHTKKLIPLSFLLYFYVVIFPMPTQNCKKSFNSNSFPRFFFQMGRNGSKSARPKNFFPPHKSPKLPKPRHPTTISHSGCVAITLRSALPQKRTDINAENQYKHGVFNATNFS